MTEIKTVDSKTLPRFNQPLAISDYKYATSESKFKAGERYISGLSLTLALKNGTAVKCTIPKKDLLFNIFEALFIEYPDAKMFTFTWDPENERTIVNAALQPEK